MVINKKEIELLLKNLIKKLDEDQFEDIQIDDDLYLNIPMPMCFEIDKDDFIPNVGSVEDDVNSLKISVQQDEPLTYVDFDRIATLLKYISHISNPG